MNMSHDFWIRFKNRRVMKALKYEISMAGTFIIKKYCGKPKVKTYQIPDNVTRIDKKAFENNSHLECIIASKNLISIGSAAFENCTSLKKVVLFNQLKNIEDRAFSGCKNLEEINLPDSISEISSFAFSDCTNLKTINLPQKIKVIYYKTFENCTSLESITIPRTVKKIHGQAFANCPLLKSITVAEDCEVLEGAIDKSCELSTKSIRKIVKTALKISSKSVIINKIEIANIKDLYLPSSVKYIHYNLFENAKELTNVYYDGTIENWCNIAFQEKFSNPMSVAKHLYFKNSNNEYEEIKDIIIPKSIKKLKNYQFLNISSLNSVAFEDAVTEIGTECFHNCINLTSMQLPEGLVKIYDKAFKNCQKLDHVVLPKSVTELHPSIFENCSELHTINIPFNIRNIPASLFLNCTNLTTIDVNASDFKIEEKAFKNCTSLANISKLYALTIAQEAFKNCKTLKSISFDKALETLSGEEIFMNSGLTAIQFDNKVTTIPPRTFYKCKDLKEFNVTSGTILQINSEAFAESALEEIEVDVACDIADNALPSTCKVLRSFNEELKREKNRLTYQKAKARKAAKEQEEKEKENADKRSQSRDLTIEDYLYRANKGDTYAMRRAAYHFEVAGDYKEALYWYNRAKESSKDVYEQSLSTDRIRNLEGRIRLLGGKADKDYVSPNAKGYETRASIKEKNLSPEQLYFEANDYYNGTSGHVKDQAHAIELYLKGAQQGSKYCQDKIAYFYETGQGVPQDLKKALMWYQRAATQGLYSSKDKVAKLSKFVDAAVDAPNETFRGLKPSNNLNNDVSISTFTRLAQERLYSKPYPVSKCSISSCTVSNTTLIVNVSIDLSKDQIAFLYGCEPEYKQFEKVMTEDNNKFIQSNASEFDSIHYEKFKKNLNQALSERLKEYKDTLYQKNMEILVNDINQVVKTVFGFVNVVDKEHEINYATTEATAKRLSNIIVKII